MASGLVLSQPAGHMGVVVHEMVMLRVLVISISKSHQTAKFACLPHLQKVLKRNSFVVVDCRSLETASHKVG